MTVIDVYADLFYAGARTLEETLPRACGARHPAVVLRLRGRTAARATRVDVLTGYASELRRADDHGRAHLELLVEPEKTTVRGGTAGGSVDGRCRELADGTHPPDQHLDAIQERLAPETASEASPCGGRRILSQAGADIPPSRSHDPRGDA